MGTDGLPWDSQPPCVNDSVISTSQEKSFSTGTVSSPKEISSY